MNEQFRLSRFALRLLLIGPFCILAGWWLMPYYVWMVGQWAGYGVLLLGQGPIEAVRVEVDPESVLRTGIELVIVSGGKSYPLAVTALVGNLAPYAALVFASPSLPARRMWRALAVGAGILFATHVSFITVIFSFREVVAEKAEWANGIGLFILTLPFLLWIALVYWKELWSTLESLQTPRDSAASEDDAIPPSN